jgi:hypothetical protein
MRRSGSHPRAKGSQKSHADEDVGYHELLEFRACSNAQLTRPD